jgi:radical SAM superfamily enzyme YgiQ (UPF0313 family)
VRGKPRPATVERIVEQIAVLLETHNARRFFIVDDLFGQRREEALRLCTMLAEYQKAIRIRLKLTVQIRLDRARDSVLLKAMRSAGVSEVCIGYESPIAEELEAMNKKIKPEDMIALTRIYHKAGFLVHGMFIFGYPLAPDHDVKVPVKERVRRFRSFIHKARLDTIQVLLPVPLPGTELTERLASENRVYPRDCIGWEYYDGNFPLFRPDGSLTAEDMQAAARRIMGRFYRFRNMFAVARNVLIFPAMMFSLWDVRGSWRRWYRLWRNNLIRFGGWIIFRNWVTQFRKGRFSEKLSRAEDRIRPFTRPTG